MPVEAKPLFRPDVLRRHLAAFTLPPRIGPLRPKLAAWAELLAPGRGDAHKETQLLPDFLTDFFYGLLGYTGPAGSQRYTISREQLVEVDGKFAALLGRFTPELPTVGASLRGGLAERSGHDRATPVLYMRAHCGVMS